MLSLIVPLAVGYLAVRSIASGLSGAAESGRLDVLLSAPLSRRRLVAADFLATAVELAAVLAITLALTELGSAISGAGLSFGSALAGFANVWPLGAAGGWAGRHSDRLLAAHERGHRGRCRRAGGDVHRGSRRPTRHRVSTGSDTAPCSATTGTRSRTASTRWPSLASSLQRRCWPASARCSLNDAT